MGNSENAPAGLEPETTIELEKDAIGQHIEALTEEEHNLTFLAVCRQYPQIVWWSFFWCLTAVACTSWAASHRMGLI
jgi:hypothetical protein